MTLKDLVQNIKNVALSYPSVNTFVTDDVYTLNTLRDIKYGAMVLTQQEHTHNDDDNTDTFRFWIFYVDRQTSDKSNVIDVETHGIQILKNLFATLEDLGVMWDNVTFHSFNEKFGDMCSGVYADVRLTVGSDTCGTDFFIGYSIEFKELEVTQNHTTYIAEDGVAYSAVTVNVSTEASEVSYDNETSGMESHNVQDAIDELFNDVLQTDLSIEGVQTNLTQVYNQLNDKIDNIEISIDVSELFNSSETTSSLNYNDLIVSPLYLSSRSGGYSVNKEQTARGMRLYYTDNITVGEELVETTFYAVDVLPTDNGVWASAEYNYKQEGGTIELSDATVKGINATTEIYLQYDEEGKLAIVQYTPITITKINGGGTYEKGSVVNDVVITWSTSIAPSAITLNNRPIDASLTSMNVGTVSTNSTFTIKVTDSKGGTDSKATSIAFALNKYYGVSDKDTLDNADVLALANKALGGNKTLSETTFNCSGGKYPWYCIPTSYGEPSFVVGGLPNSDFVKQELDITNASGYTEKYQLWRTKYIQTGSAVKIQVK